ncbi:MAG: hypothetical protein PHY80_03705 [Rickettsiales bacterium]|nr:hypothetical protein [Rickettsiales bacterium]
MNKIFFAVLFVLVLSSCTTNHGSYTVLSNKIVNLSEFDISTPSRVKKVVGKDVDHAIFFYHSKLNISINGALDNAFEKYDGDVMTDVTIESYHWCIPLIYAQSGWVVKGDVVKTRQ